MSKYSQTILIELLSQFKYRNIALLLVFCFQSKCLVSSYPLCKILPPIAVQKSSLITCSNISKLFSSNSTETGLNVQNCSFSALYLHWPELTFHSKLLYEIAPLIILEKSILETFLITCSNICQRSSSKLLRNEAINICMSVIKRTLR